MLQKIHRLLFFLLILFIPSQLGYHLWPAWSYVLGRKVDFLSPTLFFTDVLITLLLITWVATLRKPFRINRTTLVILGGISMFIIINIALALNRWESLYEWIKYAEFSLLGLYIFYTKPPLLKTITILSVSALFSVGLGILQMIKGGSLGGIFWFVGERAFTINTPDITKATLCIPGEFSCQDILRPYATFAHPNILAAFLGITLLWMILERKVIFGRHPLNVTQRGHHYGLAISAVIFLGIMLSFSRSSWIALVFSLVIMFPRKKKLMLAGLLFLILIIALYTPLSRILVSEAFVVRTQLTIASLQMIRNYPWFGVGNNNFLIALPSFLPQRTIYFLQPVHNIFLLMASQLGIVGVCGIISLVFYILKKRAHSPLPFSSFPPIFFLLIVGLFDHYLLTLQQGQLLFTVVLSFSLLAV